MTTNVYQTVHRQSEDHWTPVRYIPGPVTCYFCLCHIPRSAPGSSRGTRGTKAFYESSLKLWQCLACMVEHTRAQLARGR